MSLEKNRNLGEAYSFTEPESVNSKEQGFLNGVVDNIREKVSEYLGTKDKLIEEYENFNRSNVDISEAAGDFIKNADPKSFYKPDKEYLSPIGFTGSDKQNEFVIGLMKDNKDKLSTPEFRKFVYEKKMKSFQPQDPHFSELLMIETKFQLFSQIVPQENSDNLINESVANFTEVGVVSMATADLSVSLPGKNQIIDFQKLLPDGFRFSPGGTSMKFLRLNTDNDPLGIRKNIETYDLKDYKGAQDLGDDSFFESGAQKNVSYGDIAKTGGVLSLFHEISHAWQDTYYEEFGKYPYKEFMDSLLDSLKDIYALRSLEKENKISSKRADHEYNKRIDNIKMLGLNVVSDSDVEHSVGLNPQGFRITFPGEFRDGTYVIEGKNLTELFQGYVRQERDAWAHAIRLLRFYRKQGADLEPNLKTVNDFKELVDGSLKTYQDSILRDGVETGKDIKKFTIHGDKIQERNIN